MEIEKNQVSDLIDARLGDGLTVLKPEDHVDVICIAGMGGLLIRRILEEGQAKLSGVQRLVLQPNVGEYELRSGSSPTDIKSLMKTLWLKIITFMKSSLLSQDKCN